MTETRKLLLENGRRGEIATAKEIAVTWSAGENGAGKPLALADGVEAPALRMVKPVKTATPPDACAVRLPRIAPPAGPLASASVTGPLKVGSGPVADAF